MLTMSSAYSRSDAAGSMHASGLGYFPYGPQEGVFLNCLLDDVSLGDFRFPFTLPSDLDSQILLLNQPPAPRSDATNNLHILCHSEDTFSSSLCQSWPHEPFPGQYLIPEMEPAQPPAPASGKSARSCSPASDSSTLSDVSLGSEWNVAGQTAVGPSHAGPSQQTVLMPSVSAVGPVRRGRGRPRKDAPPVHQPPPLCTYVDPLTGTACNKLLNRHHDLPRHMFKHCQEEAAMVNSGRLGRERATLLPADWQESDELKLPCRFCSQRFSRADAVKRHENKEHKHRPRKG